MAVKPHPGGDPTAGCDATGKLPSFPAGSLKRGIREPDMARRAPPRPTPKQGRRATTKPDTNQSRDYYEITKIPPSVTEDAQSEQLGMCEEHAQGGVRHACTPRASEAHNCFIEPLARPSARRWPRDRRRSTFRWTPWADSGARERRGGAEWVARAYTVQATAFFTRCQEKSALLSLHSRTYNFSRGSVTQRELPDPSDPEVRTSHAAQSSRHAHAAPPAGGSEQCPDSTRLQP